MSTIGGFTFFEMRGEKLQPAADRLAILSRPGTDGEVIREEPQKTRPFEKQTIEAYTVLATANNAAVDYAALIGTLVTVVDELNWTAYNVLIADVQNIRVVPVINASVANVNYLVSATWVMKPT